MINKNNLGVSMLVYKPVNDLIPYARNSRTHSESQVIQIAASIKEFGFTNPVLIDGNNGIIAGHGRVLAARKLNMESVPCIELDYLSEAQKKAYIIADNKLALNAGWDDDLLALEMKDLKELDFDLDLTGFDYEEINKLIDDKPELIEKELFLKPIKKTRILISIDTSSGIDINEIINQLKLKGCEIDYSGN